MSSHGAFANLLRFLDQMNYSLTQTDLTDPESDYYDSKYLNPFQIVAQPSETKLEIAKMFELLNTS